jgi:hypothetical protein
MKKTINAYIHMSHEYDFSEKDFEKKWRPVARSFKFEDEDSIFIGQQSVTVYIPDDFDPIPGQVAALEAKKREALADYQQAVAEINDRLSKLQAIEFAP